MNEGIAGVSKWTTQKGLDIFTKKILLVTVNLNLHWSIIAVFNAGMINDDLVEDESEDPCDMELPALVVLDSLYLHDSAVIARNVRKWLNHEWDKKYSLTGTGIFNEQSMQLFRPKGKGGTKILTSEQYDKYVTYLQNFNSIRWTNRSNGMNNVKQR